MLSNFELIEMGKNYNVQIDDIVFKSDLKDIKIKKNMNVIVNLQSNTVNAKGTHWTTLIKRGNTTLFFDSFGAISPVEVIKYSKPYKKAYNYYIIQDLSSDRCGSYCFALLHYLKKHKGELLEVANEFINLFEHDTKRNDNILKKYFHENKMILK